MSLTSSSSGGDNERTELLPGHFRASSNDGLSPIVKENNEVITVRRPILYHNITRERESHNLRGTQHRYRYYSRLDPQRESSLIMPNHIVPPEFYLVIPVKPEEGKQSSIITIFSIWNTMMGTSILTMPWALGQAGFSSGIVIIILMAILTMYTTYRIMRSAHTIPGVAKDHEFTDVCAHFLGKSGEVLSISFSLVALLGAAIVYWVLMSNFLYHAVKFTYDKINMDFNATTSLVNETELDVYCPHPPHKKHHNMTFEDHSDNTTDPHLFHVLWHQQHTVPFFLLVLIFPLINFKSATFFTKFNALGTVSVVYILSFIAVKAAKWGINLDISGKYPDFDIPEIRGTFPALTGLLSLAFFIHNCVLSIVRNQKKPENNTRDVSIAFALVAFTYLFIGITFYMCFPLPKDCIEDNLLNNFLSSDVMAFTARVFLLFQMITVFPLLIFIFRAQVLNAIFENAYPSLKHVLGVNSLVLLCCLMFAVFLPNIGLITRFSGAFCGLVYVFALPCVVYMVSLKQEKLTKTIIVFHVIIITIGFLNLFAQFILLGF